MEESEYKYGVWTSPPASTLIPHSYTSKGKTKKTGKDTDFDSPQGSLFPSISVAGS